MAYMGVDIGTTGSKAVVLNLEGNIIAAAYHDYPLTYPHPGWAELDPVQVWDAVSCVIREAASKSTEPVNAIAFSALGEAVTPVDHNGNPLDKTIIAMDSRAEKECEWLADHIGAENLYHITGQPLHPMYSLNKILWWKNHKPDVFQSTWKFLCWQDYAAYKLCGKAVIDFSLASRTLLFDLRDLKWNREILEKTGITADQLAEPMQSGEIIGTVLPEMASELGLQPDTKVVCGGFDQPSAALGAGVVASGIAVDGLGTVECVTPVLEHPVTNDQLLKGNIPCCPHVVPGMYIFMGFNFCCGSLLKWYVDQFCAEERMEAERTGQHVYDVVVTKALQTETNAFLVPHFLGSGTPHLDPRSRGAILGLNLNTNRHQLARTVLEGITFEMKQNLDILKQSCIDITELRATGGGAKSAEWLQLKSDIFTIPIVAMQSSEGGCLAMAMQAAVSDGGFSSLTDAIRVCIHTGKTFQPNDSMHKIYKNRYEVYSKIYPTIKQLNHEITSIENAITIS